MDAFETVIASILQRQGYWTLTSVKVELTKAEKRFNPHPIMSTMGLDIVGYRGSTNEILVVECKSFLDSPGVECGAFDGAKAKASKRYKLFCDARLRRVVLRRLQRQLVAGRFCAKRPSIKLCLAAGKIRGDELWLQTHFKKKGWILWGPELIRSELRTLRDAGYENSVAAIVTT